MRKTVFRVLAMLIGFGIPYLIFEGIYSLSHMGRAATSLTYELYRRRVLDHRVAPFDANDPTTRVITDPSQFDAMMEMFKANNVGIGNSPFKELKSPAVATNTEENGCKVQKPNLRKTMWFLRSNIFNPFDQLTFFYDSDRQLPEPLAAFLDRYGFRPVRLTTNPYGERRTLPIVTSAEKVLVAGDSVANGVMLDDSETIASLLQARDPLRQYINLGISGAATTDIECALEKAGKRYGGQVVELIYVLCENDFYASTPEKMISWLVDFRQRLGIGRVVLLYVPFIYNVAPEITRIPGHSHYNTPTFREQKHEILSRARKAGFAVIDYGEIAQEEARSGASQFAPLALYLDHTHLSPPGVRRLLPYFDAVRSAK
jgi:hypothetical protein